MCFDTAYWQLSAMSRPPDKFETILLFIQLIAIISFFIVPPIWGWDCLDRFFH